MVLIMNKLTIKEGITELGVTTLDGNKATVSSRMVAEVFGKRHADVLAKVDQMIERAEDTKFTERNFGLSEYKDRSGKRNREYLLTKDGVILLAMGYGGKKFIDLKVEYIKQFNQMEKLIKERHFTKVEYAPMNDALKEYRDKLDKKTSYFHYSNEANMINRIVLGMTSKEYREKHNIDKKEVRDNLAPWQLETIKELQRTNTDLIKMGLSYHFRKELIDKKYNYLFDNLQLQG